jgi:hypothetical protein
MIKKFVCKACGTYEFVNSTTDMEPTCSCCKKDMDWVLPEVNLDYASIEY